MTDLVPENKGRWGGGTFADVNPEPPTAPIRMATGLPEQEHSQG
jgi:hypothetical protein